MASVIFDIFDLVSETDILGCFGPIESDVKLLCTI